MKINGTNHQNPRNIGNDAEIIMICCTVQNTEPKFLQYNNLASNVLKVNFVDINAMKSRREIIAQSFANRDSF